MGKRVGKLDYYAQKMHARQQNRFNRHLDLMARGKMPRTRMLMRWIGKPRSTMLMEKLSKQLQSDDPNWVGSLHMIMELMHKNANKIAKVPKARQHHFEYLVKNTPHQKSLSPPSSYLVSFEKSYQEMTSTQDPKEILNLYDQSGEILGNFLASIIYEKARAPWGGRKAAKSRDVQTNPEPPKLFTHENTGEKELPVILSKFSHKPREVEGDYKERFGKMFGPDYTDLPLHPEHSKLNKEVGRHIGELGLGNKQKDLFKAFNDVAKERYGISDGAQLLWKVAQHVDDPQDILPVVVGGLHFLMEPGKEGEGDKTKELWGNLTNLTNSVSRLHSNGTKPSPQTIHSIIAKHVMAQGKHPERLIPAEGV